MTWIMILSTTYVTFLTHTAQSQKCRESVSFSACHEAILTWIFVPPYVGVCWSTS